MILIGADYGHITIRVEPKWPKKMYGTPVKAAADVSKSILLIDMEMHADSEAYQIMQL